MVEKKHKSSENKGLEKANRSDVDAGSEERGKVGQGALRGGTRKPLKHGEMASSEATRHRHSQTQSGHSSVL